MNRIGLYTLFLMLLVLSTVSPLHASDTQINAESINPGSATYYFKRVFEKAWGLVLFNDNAKYNYNRDLLRKRVSELDYITKNNTQAEIEKTSQRASFYAGELTNVTASLNNQEYTEQTKIDFETYVIYLASVRDRFPANTGEWLFVQQTIDSMRILSDTL